MGALIQCGERCFFEWLLMNSGVTTKQGIADWPISKVNNRHPDLTPDVGSLW